MPIQDPRPHRPPTTHVDYTQSFIWQERINQLEAQVERLKGALIASGRSPGTVEAIAVGRLDNWASAVADTTVDL